MADDDSVGIEQVESDTRELKDGIECFGPSNLSA